MSTETRAMRDAVLEAIIERMAVDPDILFLSGDFGSPVLDRLRAQYPARFFNVGIAEQQLINLASGLALEGYKPLCYAIAPFLTMRGFEQIRTNLALLAEFRPLQVMLLGVGAGFSYTLSGPTHQCLEDLSLMRLLPNISTHSPADWQSAQSLLHHAITRTGVSYFRLDAAPLPALAPLVGADLDAGFRVLREGKDICLIATGYMVHRALQLASLAVEFGVSCAVLDIFSLSPLDSAALACRLGRYRRIITLEEGFGGRGGLDALILDLVNRAGLACRVDTRGVPARYRFGQGPREHLLNKAGLGDDTLLPLILSSHHCLAPRP